MKCPVNLFTTCHSKNIPHLVFRTRYGLHLPIIVFPSLSVLVLSPSSSAATVPRRAPTPRATPSRHGQVARAAGRRGYVHMLYNDMGEDGDEVDDEMCGDSDGVDDDEGAGHV